jgi:hypothetical protein
MVHNWVDGIVNNFAPYLDQKRSSPMKSLQNNKLAILNAGCEKFPKTAVSLLDIMLELSAYKIFVWGDVTKRWIEKT